MTAVQGARWSAPEAPVGSVGSAVLEYSAATHVGLVRSVNEDSFLAGPPVFVVADGMGGHDRGDLASTIVVEAFEPLRGRVAVVASDLDACIEGAREEIRRLADDSTAPGSTVIVAAYVLQSDHGYWLTAHEGDSRAYVWRHGLLEQITRDHSLVQELVDAGEIEPVDARFHPDRNVITRALGGYADSSPEFCLEPVEPGTRLLLCTDGLTGELSEASIAQILDESPGSEEAVERLVRAAVDAGGHDNITVVVVDVLAAEHEVEADTLDTEAAVREDTLQEDTVRILRRAL